MMLKNTILFIALVYLNRCNYINKKQDDLYQIINQNFFQFVDSSAYLTGRLIQIPFNSEKITTHKKLCITVDTVQMLSNRLFYSINLILQKSNISAFNKLILNKHSVKLDTIELSRIKNIGRFELLQLTGSQKKECIINAGKLTFYTPYISNTLALLTYTISVSSKSGITKVKLLKNTNGLWKQVQEFEIERW